MASHIADWAWFGNPDNPLAQRLLIDVCAHRIVNTDSNTQEILAWLEAMTQARRLQLAAEAATAVASESAVEGGGELANFGGELVALLVQRIDLSIERVVERLQLTQLVVRLPAGIARQLIVISRVAKLPDLR